MIGSTILHYEIVELLGRGAMGSAYKARDTRLDTFRTLKFLHADLKADPAARDHLVREARVQARLLHPNICALMALEITEEQSFLVLQYVDGQSLDRYLKSENPDTDERFGLILQVAGALDAAHEAGVIHRDIKPENVLVDRDGTVRVTDFGLSRALGATGLSASLETKGTAAYMPPESFQGQRVDKRGDVWSLGVLAHEVLSGALPFKGETFEALAYQILHSQPQQLERSVTEAIPGIAEFMNHCLNKDPRQRYADCGEAYAVLERIAWTSGHGDAVPKHVLEHYRRRWRRKTLRRVAQVAAAAGVVLASWVAYQLLRPAKAELIHTWSSSVAGGITSISWHPDGSSIAYLSRRSYAGILIRDALDREAPVQRLSLGASGDIRSVRWAPNGEVLAVTSPQGTFLAYPEADSVQMLTDREFDNIAWSSDGRYLVYCDRGRIISGRSDVGILGPLGSQGEETPMIRPLDLVDPPQGHYYNPIFILGDTRIAFVVDQSGVHRGLWSVPAEGGMPTSACDPENRVLEELRAWDLRWTEESNVLLFSRLEANGLFRIRLDGNGKVIGSARSMGVGHQVSDFDYHAPTRTLAATSNAWNFMVVGLPLDSGGSIAAGATVTTVFETIEQDDVQQLFSPVLDEDRNAIILSALSANGLELHRLDISRGEITDLIPGTGEMTSEWQPSVDPSGSGRIAFVARVDNTPHLFVFDGTYHKLSTANESVIGPEWSPDGGTIYYCRNTGAGAEARSEIVRLRLNPNRRDPVAEDTEVLLDNGGDMRIQFERVRPDESGDLLLYQIRREVESYEGAETSVVDELGILRVSTGEHRLICPGSFPALDPSRRNAYFQLEESLHMLENWTTCFDGPCEPRRLDLPAGDWQLSLHLGPPLAVGEGYIYMVVQDHMEGDLLLYRLRK